MTLQASRQPWLLSLGEQPRPAGLPGVFDVVRTSAGIGMAAVDDLRDQGEHVGPILCCPDHRVLLIPVEAGTAAIWQAPHSVCQPLGQWSCESEHEPHRASSRCSGRFWMYAPGAPASTATPAALHHSLSVVRSRIRSARSSMARSRLCEDADA